MLRAAILLTSACLLLSACRDESASSSANKAPDATSGTAPPVAKVWTETETFGVASCDRFAAAIEQCFAASKLPASDATGVREGYEQEFERWRMMKAEPGLEDMLQSTCDRHIKDLADTKMGLGCP
jgi:hypothetical protein